MNSRLLTLPVRFRSIAKPLAGIEGQKGGFAPVLIRSTPLARTRSQPLPGLAVSGAPLHSTSPQTPYWAPREGRFFKGDCRGPLGAKYGSANARLTSASPPRPNGQSLHTHNPTAPFRQCLRSAAGPYGSSREWGGKLVGDNPGRAMPTDTPSRAVSFDSSDSKRSVSVAEPCAMSLSVPALDFFWGARRHVSTRLRRRIQQRLEKVRVARLKLLATTIAEARTVSAQLDKELRMGADKLGVDGSEGACAVVHCESLTLANLERCERQCLAMLLRSLILKQ